MKGVRIHGVIHLPPSEGTQWIVWVCFWTLAQGKLGGRPDTGLWRATLEIGTACSGGWGNLITLHQLRLCSRPSSTVSLWGSSVLDSISQAVNLIWPEPPLPWRNLSYFLRLCLLSAPFVNPPGEVKEHTPWLVFSWHFVHNNNANTLLLMRLVKLGAWHYWGTMCIFSCKLPVMAVKLPRSPSEGA